MTPILTGACSPNSPSFPHKASSKGRTQLPVSPGQHPASLQSLLLRNIEVRTPCPLSVCGHQNSCPKLAGAEKPWRHGCVRDFCEMLSPSRFLLATELPFCSLVLCLPRESLQGDDNETVVGQDWLVSPWAACKLRVCLWAQDKQLRSLQREKVLSIGNYRAWAQQSGPTCPEGCTAGTFMPTQHPQEQGKTRVCLCTSFLHASSGKSRFKKTTPMNYTWDWHCIYMGTAKVKKCWLYKHYQAVRELKYVCKMSVSSLSCARTIRTMLENHSSMPLFIICYIFWRRS